MLFRSDRKSTRLNSKQKTAYEIRFCDWSSDVCSSDLIGANTVVGAGAVVTSELPAGVLAVGAPARVVRTLG